MHTVVLRDLCLCACGSAHTKWLLNKPELVLIVRCIIHST